MKETNQKEYTKKIKHNLRTQKLLGGIWKLKFISFIVLGPALFHPLAFCPFRMPFIYCSVCHIRCIQGKLRWWVFGILLIINLPKRFFCYRLCPCGSLQDWLIHINGYKFRLPSARKFIKYSVYTVLMFVLVAMTLPYNRITEFMKMNAFHIGRIALYIFTGAVLLSLFIPRLWCRIFCPVDSSNSIISKAIKKL